MTWAGLHRPGSVQVTSLFDVETLPTLHQLTSSITARIERGTAVSDIIRALFPSGSITGAPKKRATEIIGELEKSPRGVYTGCIGYVSPPTGHRFSFLRSCIQCRYQDHRARLLHRNRPHRDR